MSKSARFFIYAILCFLLSGLYFNLVIKTQDKILLGLFIFSQFLGCVCLILSSRNEPKE